MNDRELLLALLKRRSFRRGDFLLASGTRSSYYIDARLTTMSGEGQFLIGRLGLKELDQQGWNPRAVGGLTLGADPVAYAIAHTAATNGRQLDAFTVRKQPKQHGTARLIEGAFESGHQVVVVEDVITTGESALQAVASLRAAGGVIIGVLAVVDREEGGRNRLLASGIEVVSLVTASELLVAND